MKNKKIIAGILAFSMMLAAVGCGEKEETDTASDTSSAVTEVTTAEAAADEPEVTEEQTAAEDKIDSDIEDIDIDDIDLDLDMNDEDEPEEEEPASADELKEVQELVKKYEKAVNDNDYETIADITDIDLVCAVSTGNETDRDTIISILKGETDGETITIPAATTGTAFGEPRCYNSAARTYNDFLSDPNLAEIYDASSKYVIDGLYMFNMSSSSTAASDDSSLSVNGDFNISLDMYVFRINGEWKIDCGYGMMVDLAKMFMNMTLE